MDALIKLAEIKVNKYKSSDNHSIIMEYIKDNNIVLRDIITNIPDQYHVYSINPVKDSNNLCNLLYPLNKYVSLQTSILNKIFVIKLDNFPYITIELLYLYNNNKLLDLMDKVDGFTIMSDVSKIILMCQQLYHPDNLSNGELIDEVNALVGKFLATKKINDTVYNIRKGFKYNMVSKIFGKLMKSDIDFIFLSYYALNHNDLNFNNPIHIIISSQNYVLLNLIKTVFNQLIIADDHMYVINDFRIKLQIISILVDGKKSPIMYIYNSSSYELIPTIEDHIPNKYVILRFLFLDLLKRDIYQSSSTDVISNIVKAHAMNNDVEIEFEGIYRDTNFDRILYNKNSKMINIYRPLFYERDNGKLREF